MESGFREEKGLNIIYYFHVDSCSLRLSDIGQV